MPVTSFPHPGPRPAYLADCPSYMSEYEFLVAKDILGCGVAGTIPTRNELVMAASSFEANVAEGMAKKKWVRILRRVHGRIKVMVTNIIYDDIIRALNAYAERQRKDGE